MVSLQIGPLFSSRDYSGGRVVVSLCVCAWAWERQTHLPPPQSVAYKCDTLSSTWCCCREHCLLEVKRETVLWFVYLCCLACIADLLRHAEHGLQWPLYSRSSSPLCFADVRSPWSLAQLFVNECLLFSYFSSLLRGSSVLFVSLPQLILTRLLNCCYLSILGCFLSLFSVLSECCFLSAFPLLQ